MKTSVRVETGSDVPQVVTNRAAQRFLNWKRSSGKIVRHYDDRLASVLRDLGSPVVSQVINASQRLGMTQSIIDYDMLIGSIAKFLETSDNHNLYGLKDYEEAKERVRRELLHAVDGGKLAPLSVTSVSDLETYLPNLQASAGYLGIVTGHRLKGEVLEDLLECFNYKMEHLDSMDYSPIVAGIRTNIRHILDENGKLNPNWDCKTRMIHVVSADDVAIEMLTAQPLMALLSRVKFYAGGVDQVTLNADIVNATRRFKCWASLDYSSYDASLPDWLIRDAFNLIFSLFGDSISEEYRRFIVDGFCYARMILPEGKIARKRRGVPSGSYFTQAVDTICNAIMFEYYALKRGLKHYEYRMMGDDNLVFTRRPLDLKDLSRFLKRQFGVDVNADKSSQDYTHHSAPEFLSRRWYPDGADRHVAEVIVKALNPEKERDYANYDIDPMLIFRALMDVYPRTMRKYFNLGKFIDARPDLKMRPEDLKVYLGSLPGAVRYKLVYLDGVTSLASEKGTKPGTKHSGRTRDRAANQS